MNAISGMTRRLAMSDPAYKNLVYFLADVLKDGRYNVALLLDAVMLADEVHTARAVEDMLRHPNVSIDAKIKMVSADNLLGPKEKLS